MAVGELEETCEEKALQFEAALVIGVCQDEEYVLYNCEIVSLEKCC